MQIFITGIGTVSPNGVADGDTVYRAVEPKYREFIPPMVARRMGRPTKMAIVAALRALKDADRTIVDGVITGTGLGEMVLTKKFMNAMTEHKEEMLNPASFIYSTHNTMSSSIANLLKCNGYNATYSQRELSFEIALADGKSLIEDELRGDILVGGSDEYIEELLEISLKVGLPQQLKFGEGASYFLLSHQPTENSVELCSLTLRFSGEDPEDVLTEALQYHNVSQKDLTAIFVTHDGIDFPFFPHAIIRRMYPIVGFSLTASAHALYHAVGYVRKHSGSVVAVVNHGLRGELSVMILK